MVYQQCGQACPQTCETEETVDCADGCVEGCFCPSGKVLWNGNCINSSECAGMHFNVFNHEVSKSYHEPCIVTINGYTYIVYRMTSDSIILKSMTITFI